MTTSPRQKQDIKTGTAAVFAGFDFLRADLAFGWRQLIKRKVTAGAAMLSLALAIGSCTAAFRLVDALFLRAMPIRDPANLYVVSYNGFKLLTNESTTWASNSYPMFRSMRDQLKGQAQMVAASFISRVDLTYGSPAEMEKAYRQSVSGELFSNFGLQPALGRLFTERDDQVPGAEPYAVLSYDYWKARFGQDPKVVGRTFRMGDDVYEIVGVAPAGFTGTEPGTVADVFLPTMMESGSVNRNNSFWLRIFVRPKPGTNAAALARRMDAFYQVWERERAKGFFNFPKSLLATYPTAHLLLQPAGAGSSNLQTDYSYALTALSVLVVLVLLIACANVANLMTAQAAAREREMALRVSIGASRWRLVQLVMTESATVALISAGLGVLFSQWAAPFVVSQINPPDNPARLAIPTDWKVLMVGLILAASVTSILGLIPAIHVTHARPVSVLKGTERPRAKRTLMYAMIAAQIAFCFVVLFGAGLFATTFQQLTMQPLGFSADRLVLLDTVAQHPQPAFKWDQMVESLRAVPGVETTALEDWPLMSGTMHNDHISVNNSPASDVLTFFLGVSPGWLNTMRIPILSGRDLRDNDLNPGIAMVNETFAKQYFDGVNPIGKTFDTKRPDGTSRHFEIVGLVRDAAYRSLREAMLPQAYTPIHGTDPSGAPKPIQGATIVVRTAVDNPLGIEQTLIRAVTRTNPEFRVSNATAQTALIKAQTVRERILAKLALFFASVALLLAALGLYGVLHYTVVQRRREIGIRIAIGARAGNIAWLMTSQILPMVAFGAAAGLGLGLASSRFVATLLYGVHATDPFMLIRPVAVLLTAALLATTPALIRATMINPADMLRAE
jgi:predicted permease